MKFREAREAREGITGDSWLDDLARASLSAAEAKFSPCLSCGARRVSGLIDSFGRAVSALEGPNDLVAFLNTRVGEEELAASMFSGNPRWSAEMLQRLYRRPGDPVLVHAARYDPERALREVEAKRRLLDTAQRLFADAAEMAADAGGIRYRPGEWMTYMSIGRVILACLGWPYLDHPEFPDGWRPYVSCLPT